MLEHSVARIMRKRSGRARVALAFSDLRREPCRPRPSLWTGVSHEAVLRISTNSRAHSDLKEVSLLAGESVSFLLLR
jgi:hypothetical protein